MSVSCKYFLKQYSVFKQICNKFTYNIVCSGIKCLKNQPCDFINMREKTPKKEMDNHSFISSHCWFLRHFVPLPLFWTPQVFKFVCPNVSKLRLYGCCHLCMICIISGPVILQHRKSPMTWTMFNKKSFFFTEMS